MPTNAHNHNQTIKYACLYCQPTTELFQILMNVLSSPRVDFNYGRREGGVVFTWPRFNQLKPRAYAHISHPLPHTCRLVIKSSRFMLSLCESRSCLWFSDSTFRRRCRRFDSMLEYRPLAPLIRLVLVPWPGVTTRRRMAIVAAILDGPCDPNWTKISF